jgi:predicted TIM-barrel fold metal-dependent hydrolase
MSEMIVDAHMHIGAVFGVFATNICAEHILSIMDDFNISHGFVTAASSSLNNNLKLMGEVSKYPGRLFGFYWVNPKRSSILDEVSRALKHGFVGLKFRPETDGYSLFNISLLDSILSYACRMRMPVYVHCSGYGVSHPNALKHICSMYPELKVIVGHMAQGSVDAIKVAEDFDNVFLETSTYRGFKVIEYAVNRVGSDRVLFGSDYPYSNLQMEISKIMNLKISWDDKLKIMGLNSLSLLPSKPPLKEPLNLPY